MLWTACRESRNRRATSTSERPSSKATKTALLSSGDSSSSSLARDEMDDIKLELLEAIVVVQSSTRGGGVES